MKILHVTEVFASGVLSLLASISARQVHRGADVVIQYAVTPETPSAEELRRIFDPRVTLVEVAGHSHSRLRSTWLLRRSLREALRQGNVDVVHLHSTYAGIIGRIAVGHRRYARRTFYSPHGFAFLQRNRSGLFRSAARTIERLASRRGALVLSAESERQLALEILGGGIRCWVVLNGIDTTHLPAPAHRVSARPTVAMIGRIAYQKGPWIFARAAAELGGEADFVWLGDGPEADKREWLSNVSISGWVPLEQLRESLQSTDIVLFCTQWEGMPLSLIEAQAMGVPAVATRIPGNQDVVIDGATGYLAASDDELIERTRELIRDPQLREQMGARAVSVTRGRFDDRRLDDELSAVYESSIRGDAPPALVAIDQEGAPYVPDPILPAQYT